MAHGIYLNTYFTRPVGEVRLFCLPDAAKTATRTELRDELGVNVYVDGGDAYTFTQPEGHVSSEVTLSLSKPRRLALFGVREALLQRCRDCGAADVWSGSTNELHARGLLPSLTVDRFRLDSHTGIRVSTEDYLPDGILLTVRHSYLWRTTATIDSDDVARHAVGRAAGRVSGEGPSRGKIIAVSGQRATILSQGAEHDVASRDYELSVNTALVAAWRGSQVLRRIRVAAGDVMQNGSANPAAIKDRFKLAGKALRCLGNPISLGDGVQLEVPEYAVAVRLEAAT